MERICVYLGANFGTNPAFRTAVEQLADKIVIEHLTLVYGGSSLGLMGLLADRVKKQGGKVIGVTCEHLLAKEKPMTNLDELYLVQSMQARKKMLQDLSDAFIVVPGGLGTLEEAVETWNAIKVGELNKKIGFLNLDNYFALLFEFIQHCEAHQFMNKRQVSIPFIHNDPSTLLMQLRTATENLKDACAPSNQIEIEACMG